eukprot:TRINITY_DN2245_c0_g1_i1.p1 TRINITY_DN2245_c0_g1~~TRINITY_DN2245_c0_g1_i1.p1  ORF type:complete len:610 (-),score=116.44 TRINITY_DN2245_c0_g1_i1:302-2131(-)
MSLDTYLSSLAVLERLNQSAKVEIRLPRLCVAGDQGSGKSSLLTSLTGISLPISMGTCTKSPIHITCCRDNESKYEIENRQSRVYEACTREQLPQRIIDAQQELLRGSERKISYEEVKVKVTGPNMINGDVVDLPGLIHHGPELKETRELMQHYLLPEMTVALVVSEANRDDELVGALGMGRGDSKRTMRILTKFDKFDGDDERMRAVQKVNSSGQPQAVRMHAVICRPNGTDGFDVAAEKEELRQLGVAEAFAGVEKLKQILDELYADLIRTNMPAMKTNVKRQRDEAANRLRDIGTEPVSPAEMIRRCSRAIQDGRQALEEATTEVLLSFAAKVEAADQCTKTLVIVKPNDFECPLFAGKDALRACMKDVAACWMKLVQDLKYDVCRVHNESVRTTMTAVRKCGVVPNTLENGILAFWADKLEELSTSFDALGKQLIENTTSDATLNSKAASSIDPTICSIFNEFVDRKLKFQDVANTGWSGSSPKNMDIIQQNLKSNFQDFLKEKGACRPQKQMHEQQQDRLSAYVKNWWNERHQQFIKQVSLNVNACFLRGLFKWVDDLPVNEAMAKLAVEEDGTRSLRGDCKRTRTQMDDALRKLEALDSIPTR